MTKLKINVYLSKSVDYFDIQTITNFKTNATERVALYCKIMKTTDIYLSKQALGGTVCTKRGTVCIRWWVITEKLRERRKTTRPREIWVKHLPSARHRCTQSIVECQLHTRCFDWGSYQQQSDPTVSCFFMNETYRNMESRNKSTKKL